MNTKSRVGVPVVLLAAFLGGQGCRPSRPALTPESRLEAVEGYASLSIDLERGRGRSKVSFSLQLPDRARIDVFDALGRSLITLINRGNESYFVLVPKKAYWQGGRDEMIERFLGFSLNLEELAGIFAGRWISAEDRAGAGGGGWTLERDSKNRAVVAERNDVTFRVIDFFPGTSLPHTLSFRSGRSSGRIKVFEVKFNVPRDPDGAELWFLGEFRSKTWPEMESLLADEPEVIR